MEIRHHIDPNPIIKRTLCCRRLVSHLPIGDWAVFDASKSTCPGPRNRRIVITVVVGLALLVLRFLA